MAPTIVGAMLYRQWEDRPVTADGELEIPRTLRLMWGTPEPPRRGPKPTTSLSEIAAVAVALADAEGLAAASLPRLAAKLESGTSSLYRYFQSRDDLDAAMLDYAYGEPPTYDGIDRWQDRLRHWALANRTVLNQHPWILQLPTLEPPLGPHRTAWTERGLTAFDDGTGTSSANLSALLLVEIFIRGYAQLSTPPAHVVKRDDPFASAPYSRRLAAVLSVDSYPLLTRAITDGTLDSGGDDFTQALDTLIEGIERRRSNPSPPEHQ